MSQTVQTGKALRTRDAVRRELPSTYDRIYFDGLTVTNTGRMMIFYDAAVPKIRVEIETGEIEIAGPDESL